LGEHGLATRVLAGRFGSRWTYAGSLADIGQLAADTLLDDFQFRSITPSTEVYGIVGRPIAHSVSPAMHNAAFRAAPLDAVYLPFPAVDVDDFAAAAQELGIKRRRLTAPFTIDRSDRAARARDSQMRTA